MVSLVKDEELEMVNNTLKIVYVNFNDEKAQLVAK